MTRATTHYRRLLRRKVVCPDCNGYGSKDGGKTCPTCLGAGEVEGK